jgi:hypothetical protein
MNVYYMVFSMEKRFGENALEYTCYHIPFSLTFKSLHFATPCTHMYVFVGFSE